mgnify:CR=1 FL=1
MQELRHRHPEFDYVVGSVHHLDGASIDMHPKVTAKVAREVGGKEALERLYFDMVAEMVEQYFEEGFEKAMQKGADYFLWASIKYYMCNNKFYWKPTVFAKWNMR